MGDMVVLSSEDGMNRYKSSEVVQWEKYLPKTVLRVLLVESDDSTRQIITALLRKCCYKVEAVSDGLAAWEILKEKSNNIDVILSELDLPSISGFALLTLVMEHEPCKNIPVIIMSSQDSIQMVLKCMLRGAADYLIKPMRKNELKNLWQHVWRRVSLRDDPTAHPQSLPGSHQNLEDTDETSADSRYHSDQGSGAQANRYNGHKQLMENAKLLDGRDKSMDCGRTDKKLESSDVTMDLICGIDKQPECIYGETSDKNVGPELGLSLKRSCSVSLDNQDDSKHQKLSLSDASAFSQFGSSKPAERAIVAVEASSSGEPKTPTESHEKLRKVRSDQGSATTSSNQENIGSSSISGQCGHKELSFRNQVLSSTVKESSILVESNILKAATKKLEVGSQSTSNTNEAITGQSSNIDKPKEEGSLNEQQSSSRTRRQAALEKFRLKKKNQCFDKKVRYQSRKKLAEQRPRVKGQFVRSANSGLSTKP